MLVKQRMSPHPFTVSVDTPVTEALSLMRQKHIRRLPVMNKKGRLAGIVSEKDLLYASPSPATSLSVYEVGYLLSKLKVKEVMSHDLITIASNAPIEEAACIMVDNKIGGLPVLEEGKMVGIITETDIFKTMLEMLGARESGVRLTVEARDKPGVLSLITGKIAELGGDIVALGTFYGDDRTHSVITLKVRGVDQATLPPAMEELDAKVLDIRTP
jgi:acetoin utilization protein AcuB